MSDVISDDYFRFGHKCSKKILSSLGIIEYGKSRIDGNIIIEIDNENTLVKLKTYFKLLELNEIIPSVITYIKIIDFSTDKWKEFEFKQKFRKEKLTKLNNL